MKLSEAESRRSFFARIAAIGAIDLAAVDDLTLAVARTIDPVMFGCTPEMYGTDAEGFKNTMAYGAQLVAVDRARQVISIVRAAISAEMEHGKVGE